MMNMSEIDEIHYHLSFVLGGLKDGNSKMDVQIQRHREFLLSILEDCIEARFFTSSCRKILSYILLDIRSDMESSAALTENEVHEMADQREDILTLVAILCKEVDGAQMGKAIHT